MSGWRALRCSTRTRCRVRSLFGQVRPTGATKILPPEKGTHPTSRQRQSSRQESNLPEPAYQTGAWPLGHSWKRPVRGLNPSHPVDSRADTPASSQGGKDGRIRTLSARVGAALLSQEHILTSVPRPGLEPGTPRSKRGMISVSPSGYFRAGRVSDGADLDQSLTLPARILCSSRGRT